jgi:hypothetical protein
MNLLALHRLALRCASDELRDAVDALIAEAEGAPCAFCKGER